MSCVFRARIAGALVVCPLVAAVVCAQMLPPEAPTGVTTTEQPMRQPMRIPGQHAFTFGVVMGMVRATDDRPLGSVEVLLRGADGKRRFAITSGDGIFRMGNLPAGTYTLTASAPALEPVEHRNLVVAIGEIVIVELRMKISATASARDRWISGPVQSTNITEALAPYRELQRRPLVLQDLTPEMLPPEDKVAIENADRWDIANPPWTRYPGREGEYPYEFGRWWDPFNRNTIKGDYPIFGQQNFFAFTGTSTTAVEARRLYVPRNQSAPNIGGYPFFGHGQQLFVSETVRLSFDLFHGDTSFRPIDWRVRVTPAFNINQIWTKENGIVNVDVRKGTDRLDSHVGLQEAFAEAKIRDLSPYFDFVSVRAGIQAFTSDFRGFVFSDEQPGVRLFGNLKSNRIQYNAAYFQMLEKDTNSGLNKFARRHQQVLLANVYIQDFFTHGYTAQFSYHFNKDDASIHYDENGFLVRPAPIGSVAPHDIRAHYIGWTGNGHIGRLNVSHAAYEVLGYDSRNLIAGRRTDLNAQFAALELSVDHDWFRPRASFLFASGDKNPRDRIARGFDSIIEAQTFAGGEFSFFNREGIRLSSTGVALNSPESFLPSLRSSKEEGQASYVNPGILLWNTGVDIDVTPQLRAVLNGSYMRFHHTEPLTLLLLQSPIADSIGFDYGMGVIYRPKLSDNIVIITGLSALTPGTGLRQIYQSKTLLSGFTVIRLQF